VDQASRRRRTIVEWLLVIVVIALGVPAVAWFLQERLIFFPQVAGAATHLPPHASALEIVAADGTHLRGWIVRGAATSTPALIYFGGNAEEVSWTLADKRWPREWTIVGMNYRGYGASEGEPSETALDTDALTIYDAVASREDIDRTRIVVFGRSLGTAIAAHLAAERPVAGAVLVSPFDSLVAVGRRHYPWLPVSLLLRHRFDALSDAKRSAMPLLAIVGESDSIIPVERSRALFDAWAGPKTWQVMPGADHNDLGDLGSDDGYWEHVRRFLATR
jgi:pimeloyl-ACP methyl ester carboxylesterase